MNTFEAPVADWVEIAALEDDPFPILARMRDEAAVHWVPAVNRYLVTRYEDCHRIELDAETFSADEAGSLMKRSMGHAMLRKDDPEHRPEREAWQPALRPGAIKVHWRKLFEENTTRHLDRLGAGAEAADLIADFAAPLAADNLRAILGLRNASTEDMQRWSQTLINATGNYADDPDVWAAGERSYAEVDAALEEMLPYYRDHPDATLISGLLNAGDYRMPVESIRSNLKMTIAGGLNEPRDALGVTAWALLERRDQLEHVLADRSRWAIALDEALRWVAPIGMYPRQTTRPVELDGVAMPAGARLGVVVLSANRDERWFDRPDDYDIRRERKPHLAFGGGAHYCAGAWVAKSSVAGVALPALFERFPNLQLDPDDEVRLAGWGVPRAGAAAGTAGGTMKVTFVSGDASRDLDVPAGTSLMQAAVMNAVPGIVGECGGQAMCATCHVLRPPGVPGRAATDRGRRGGDARLHRRCTGSGAKPPRLPVACG